LYRSDGKETPFIKRIIELPGDGIEAVQELFRANKLSWWKGPLVHITVPNFSAEGVCRDCWLWGTIAQESENIFNVFGIKKLVDPSLSEVDENGSISKGKTISGTDSHQHILHLY